METDAGGNGGNEEPLPGCVILEQARAGVDMPGHRLAPVRYVPASFDRAVPEALVGR